MQQLLTGLKTSNVGQFSKRCATGTGAPLATCCRLKSVVRACCLLAICMVSNEFVRLD